MNFSFCLPTLGNRKLVKTFLDSLERTTADKKNTEVLFAIDEGKTEIIKYVVDQGYSFAIRWYERPATRDFTNDYYNFLATRSFGKNIIAFNDDAWIRTQDWDKKILRAINETGWSIYMLDIPDTARIKYKNPFPCFPCVSRRALNTLGWLLCKDVPMYPADLVTTDVYHTIKRIIPIRDVLIQHDHVKETDPSKSRMMQIFNEDREKKQVDGLDITKYVLELSVAANGDATKKPSKLNRIINILKGG
jgi:hypothetical protein